MCVLGAARINWLLDDWISNMGEVMQLVGVTATADPLPRRCCVLLQGRSRLLFPAQEWGKGQRLWERSMHWWCTQSWPRPFPSCHR